MNRVQYGKILGDRCVLPTCIYTVYMYTCSVSQNQSQDIELLDMSMLVQSDVVA